MNARFVFPANILSNYLPAAGAAGAPVAPVAPGAPGAPGAPAAPGAAGAAGASTFGAASCFGASLQPNTAIDKEAKKIILTKMANTFFINAYPPFTDFYSLWGFIPDF
jgi:hypothetical protein